MDRASRHMGLSESQERRLLNLSIVSGDSQEESDPEERKGNALYDILLNPLPVDKLVLDSLPSVIRNLCSRLRSVAGKPVGELLQDPRADIAAIQAIKDYAKQSGTSPSSEAEAEVFLIVYNAAIASALVHHHMKITQHSDDDLEKFFLALTERAWVPKELVALFLKAAECCRANLQNSHSEHEGP